MDLLLDITATAQQASAGDIYVLPSAPYLNDLPTSEIPFYTADAALLCSVFGNEENADNAKEIWQLSPDAVDDGALRLSTTAEPSEWMVFHCVSRSDTAALAALLTQRITALQHQYRGTPSEGVVLHARVLVIGKYVISVVAPDADSAVEAVKKAIAK